MKLLKILEDNKRVPSRAKAGVYPLSGLVFCGKCKKMIRYNVRSDGYTTSSMKACNKYDHLGNYCDNRGIPIKFLTDAINEEIIDYEDQLLKTDDYVNEKVVSQMQVRLKDKEAHLEKLKRALSKIKEMYELDEYTKEEYDERKAKRQSEIDAIEQEIRAIRYELDIDKFEKNQINVRHLHGISFKEVIGQYTYENHEQHKENECHSQHDNSRISIPGDSMTWSILKSGYVHKELRADRISPSSSNRISPILLRSKFPFPAAAAARLPPLLLLAPNNAAPTDRRTPAGCSHSLWKP
ncbi:zinc ribbon domain-containing protein [Paenibacillus mangrovi]|uniref:zinc ribbon domain-containing protein n=1 Tax=Paenibacillus mangrovi TaxID=2931978 RepID=UPI0031404D16